MHHVLIVTKGLIWDKLGPSKTKFSYVREYLSGDVIHSVSNIKLTTDDWDGFTLCGCYSPIWIFNKLGPIYSAYFFIYVVIRFSFRHYFRKRYDCIISRDPIVSGPISMVLSKLWRIPFVVEMNGNYANPYAWGDPRKNPSGQNPIGKKMQFALNLIPRILNGAAGIKILYPAQLEPYKPQFKPDNKAIACFHEFTQIAGFPDNTVDEKFIMLLGAPAYVKACDTLITAFRQLPASAQDYKLLIVGWYADDEKAQLEALKAGDARIEIRDPLLHDDAQKMIERCSFMVLPSRTEGMGRVLLEAMAHGKPVVGSDVEGIPHYIRHNEDGFVTKVDDPASLASAMQRLIEDPALRKQMGARGRERVLREYSEKAYAIELDKLIQRVIS